MLPPVYVLNLVYRHMYVLPCSPWCASICTANSPMCTTMCTAMLPLVCLYLYCNYPMCTAMLCETSEETNPPPPQPKP